MLKLQPCLTPDFFRSHSQGKLTQKVARDVLPLPLLSEVKNLRYLKEGSIESRKAWKEESSLPPGVTPLKLFTYNNSLLAITRTGFLLYNESQKNWETLSTRRSFGLKSYAISQKESDLQNLGFTQFGNSFYVFYSSGSTFYYQKFSLDEHRSEGEVFFREEEGVKQAFALTQKVEGADNQIWIGFLTDAGIKVVPFNPAGNTQSVEYNLAQADIDRFVLHKDRIFYEQAEA